MNHQAAGVADIGEMREDLKFVDEAPACLIAASNAEREDSASTLGSVLLRKRVVLARRQRRDTSPTHFAVLFQMLCDRERVLEMPVHSHAKSFHSLQEKECIEGADAGADVAQTLHAGFDDESR